MKIFFAKRLRVILLSLLMVGSTILSACYDDATPPTSPTPSYVPVSTPSTCERKIRKAATLKDSLTIKDSLSWPSEECHFYFYATAGEIVTITMSSLDPDFDPALKLYDPYNSLLMENDDSVDLDSSISEQVLPWQGWYKIVAKSYNHESSGRF